MHVNTITAIENEYSTKLESHGERRFCFVFFPYDFQVFTLVEP